MRGSRGRLRLLGHPSDVLPQWYLTLRRSDAMGTCQGQRDKDCSTGLRGCSPHATGKPPGQPRRPGPLTFPVPVVCPSQCCGLQGRHSAPRRAHGPSAEPHDALRPTTCCRGPLALLSTPRHSQDAEALPARRGAAVNLRRPLAGLPTRAKPPYGAARVLRPGTPRAGRGRGGPSAPAASSRPGPKGTSSLRSRAPEVTSARSTDPAQSRAAPSPKASAPLPTPQPRRQPR